MSCTVPTQAEVTAVIKRMRQQGTDDGLCEAKSCEHELGRSVWASVSAFANTNGGLLLLGIDENAGFTVPDGFDANKVIAQFIDGIGDGSANGARLTNPPAYELARVEVDGRQAVAVRIEENKPQNKPCYVTGRGLPTGAYHRVDDHDVTMSTTDVFEMINLMTPSVSEHEEIEGSSAKYLDQELLNRFLSKCGNGSATLNETLEQKLAWLGITTADGKLRLCSLVALGAYPQGFLPACSIDVIAWPGTADDFETNLRYTDRKICEGPLPEMVQSAVSFVMRNLRCCGVLQGIGRIDIPEVPEEAVREAIANAALHREYSPYFRGTHITVGIYRDRIEITSPGGFWGGKTLANLFDGVSRCRNPSLMHIACNTPYGIDGSARTEGIGRGVSTMTKKMRDQGLPAPSFKVTPDQVTVRLFRPSIWPPEVDQWGNVTFPENPPLKIPEIRISEDAPRITSLPDYAFTGEWSPSWIDKDGFAPAGFGPSAAEKAKGFHPAGFDPVTEWQEELKAYMKDKQVEKRVRNDEQGRYFMMTKDGWVLDILRERYPEPLTIHEIAERGEKSLPVTRRAIRELIDAGEVLATAPATSRNRKYLAAECA